MVLHKHRALPGATQETHVPGDDQVFVSYLRNPLLILDALSGLACTAKLLDEIFNALYLHQA